MNDAESAAARTGWNEVRPDARDQPWGHNGASPLDKGKVANDLGEQQFDDCWLFSVTGPGVGAGSDAALCFDSADEIVYIRVRSVKES